MMNTSEWYLKRNCSLTPRQLGLAYAILVLVSLVVSGMAALVHGAWEVLLFFLIEMVAVGFAFLCYARHATDHEHVALSQDCLLVERVLADRLDAIRLDPRATRVRGPRDARDLIALEARGVRVCIGAHVTAANRRRIARELQQQLSRQGQSLVA
ncbi:MAG TPA: DUF2244 domain-containing protein [Noviherbaspirillum sp.]